MGGGGGKGKLIDETFSPYFFLSYSRIKNRNKFCSERSILFSAPQPMVNPPAASHHILVESHVQRFRLALSLIGINVTSSQCLARFGCG